MNRKVKLFAVVLSIVLGLVLVGVAYAITITVDGIKEAAWDGSGGQTPGVITDTNESDIDDRYDISEVRWTNDSLSTSPWGHMYFLVTTYANFDNNFPALAPQIIICIDVDNNTATGTTTSGYCNDSAGIDRRITANLRLLTVSVERWNGTAWVVVGNPTGGERDVAWEDVDANGIADLPYIEIGVDLGSLGITNTATCIGAMPSAIYYDNGMADPEDTVPDNGTFSIGCGNPTAITLNNVEARTANNNTAVLILVATATLALGVVGVVARRRKQHAL